MTEPTRRPAGFALVGVFFYFGALMSAYAAVTLFRPGTFLDRLWALNRRAHVQLASLGRVTVLPFAVLAVVLLLAATGWFRRQYWGWLLGLSVLVTNLAANLIHAAMGDWFRSGLGIIIAGLLLSYLVRPRVRAYFLPRDHSS